METKLVQYIRDKKRRPYGMVVALVNDEGKWNIGWSLCHTHDVYDSRIAHTIAESRAKNLVKTPSEFKSPVPESIIPYIERMYYRAMNSKVFANIDPMYQLSEYFE